MKVFSNNTNIGLRHLRAALTVRQEGSFGRAAARLGVVPSALTETIRALEAECGTTIFDRKTRPIGTTAAGEAFLLEAAPLLDRFELSLDNLRQIGGMKRGRVSIGAAPSAVFDPVADAIVRFRGDYPDIDIVIHDDVADRLAAMVIDRTLDFAIAGQGLVLPDLDQRKISQDRFGLVCHVAHHLAQRGYPPTFDDIDPDQIIALDSQTGISRMLADSQEVPDALRRGRIQTFSTIAQLTLIGRNAGLALLPQRAANVIQSPDIVFIPIEGFTLVRSLHLLTHSRATLTTAAARFVGYLAG